MNKLIIKFDEDVPEDVIDLILCNYDADRTHTQHQIGWHILTVAEDQAPAIVEKLHADPAVKHVFQNFTIPHGSITVVDYAPLTDKASASYHWQRDAMYLQDIWDVTTGNSNQKIAIGDTGGTPSHPDFKDENGSTRILPGVNTLHNWYSETDYSDTNGHATMVASVIGATGNNGIGNAGVNWHCKMKPFRLSENQHGDSTPIASVTAFLQAADEGFPLFNYSFGFNEFPLNTATLAYYQDAVDYAFERNCIIVSVAHNYSTDVAVIQQDIKRWLIVGATTKDNQKTDYSNYGKWVHVVAPVGGYRYGVHHRSIDHGIRIHVADKNGTYELGSNTTGFFGTSAAAPEVTGLLSLALDIAPNLTNYQKLTLARHCTSKLNARWQDEFGSAFGIANGFKCRDTAFLALPGAAPRPTVLMATPKHNSTAYLGTNDVLNVEALVFDENPITSVSLHINGSDTPYQTKTSLPYEFQWTPPSVGEYTLQFRAVSASGTGQSETNTVHVLAPDINAAPFVGFVSHRGGETVSGEFFVEAVASCYSVPKFLTPGTSVDPSAYPDPWIDTLDVKFYQNGVQVAALPQSVVGGNYGKVTLPVGVSGPITVEATAVTSDGMAATTSMDVTVAAVGTTGAFTTPAVTLRPVVSTPSITGAQRGSFSMPSVSLAPTVAAPSLTGISATVSAGSFDLPVVTLRPIVAAPQLSGMTGGASIRAPSGQLLDLRRIDGAPLTILSI